jgi:tetratricopeptide (TPR) repeat protein
MELADLAPDVAEDQEPVMELADLAPDVAEEEESFMELADVAEEEEPVMELADLAPDEPAAELEDDDEIIIDMDEIRPGASAPDAGLDREGEEAGAASDDEDVDAEEAFATVAAAEGATAEDEPVAEADDAVEDDEATPTPADGSDDDDSPGEPVYTRTLAEIYVKQGAPEKALDVLRHLHALNPDDTDLERRIEALESGETSAAVAQPPSTDADEDVEEELEILARELADNRNDAENEVESPFGWDDAAAETEAAESDSSIDDYFQGLLSWKPGKRP